MFLDSMYLDWGAILILMAVLVAAILDVGVAGSTDYMRSYRESQIVFDRDLLPNTDPSAPVSRREYELEVRQMIEAKSYCRQRRGLPGLDVDAELARVLGGAHRGATGS